MNWRLLPPGPELNRYYLITLGFARVKDLNDNAFGGIVKGPSWQVELYDAAKDEWTRSAYTDNGFTAFDAWEHAAPCLPKVTVALDTLRFFMPEVGLHIAYGATEDVMPPVFTVMVTARGNSKSAIATVTNVLVAKACVDAILDCNEQLGGALRGSLHNAFQRSGGRHA